MLLGLVLLIKGAWFLWDGPAARHWSIRSLRDPAVTVILLGLASAWFLYKVMHLGEADFGNYRNLLFTFFLAVAVGSWFFVRDFLAVRAAAALYLLIAGVLLDAAFGLYEIPQRLFMVGAVYVGIVFALYLAAVPYRARDMLNWLYINKLRPRILGGLLAGYGLLLLAVAATY